MSKFLSTSDNIKKLAYLLSESVSTSEIAKELGVSTRSVERWRQHPKVVEALDQIIRSKTKIIDDAWQQQHENYRQQIQDYMDKSIKDIAVLRELNNTYLNHVAKKLSTISHEDIPAKAIPNALKACLEIVKALDEVECTKLTIGPLLKKLDEIDNETK